MDLTDAEISMVKELAKIIAGQELLSKSGFKKKLEQLISEKTFGPGIADKRVKVRWGSLFSEGLCPICEEKMEKKGDSYESKCGMKIQSELYDKAKEQHEKEFELEDKEERIRQKMDDMNLSEDKISEIYYIALERSEKNIEEKG